MLSPENYEPPTSAWEIVCQYAAPSEHHELKHLIGADLIDQTVELRREIELLRELATDLTATVPADPAAPPAAAPPTRLPEPPQMRERLTQEIVFFLESIRERARRLTGSEAVDLGRLAVSQEIVDYAYESSSSRPSTGLSRLSLGEIRVTPCSSRAGSRTARSAAGADDEAAAASVAQMRDQLTYMRCDEVRKRLRQHLQDELEMLKEDLSGLQDAVSAMPPAGPASPSASSPASASAASLRSHREPSLAELRTERHRLEQLMLSGAATAAAAPRQSHHRLPASPPPDPRHSNKAANDSIPRQSPVDLLVAAGGVKRPSSAQRLRSLVQQSRQQGHPLASNVE